MYAISLGGDTDTIATMAGAIAGAHYGVESVPRHWMKTCEGVDDALKFAEEIYTMVEKGKETKPDSKNGESETTEIQNNEKGTKSIAGKEEISSGKTSPKTSANGKT